ncbi:MAG: IS200/IS605 family transposase [Bacteroidota bacterium]
MGSTFHKLCYHIVFSTKHRQPLLTEEIQKELYLYIGGIVKREDAWLLEIGGMPDHVHLLLQLKPIYSLSPIMQRIKGNSSRWVNQRFDLENRFSWQEGYRAFSVSESIISKVRNYIRNQEKHHQKQSTEMELKALLDRHRVDYDARYL